LEKCVEKHREGLGNGKRTLRVSGTFFSKLFFSMASLVLLLDGCVYCMWRSVREATMLLHRVYNPSLPTLQVLSNPSITPSPAPWRTIGEATVLLHRVSNPSLPTLLGLSNPCMTPSPAPWRSDREATVLLHRVYNPSLPTLQRLSNPTLTPQ
jgi:hypothetical protein